MKALLWVDRGWAEIDDPFASVPVNEEIQDWRDFLREQGWLPMQEMGDPDGLHIAIYTPADGGESRWLVEYATVDAGITILINRWQDFIDFLAHVSSTLSLGIRAGEIESAAIQKHLSSKRT